MGMKSPDLITVKEAAKVINVSIITLYRMVEDGLVTKFKANGRTYLSRTEISKYKDKAKRKKARMFKQLQKEGYFLTN